MRSVGWINQVLREYSLVKRRIVVPAATAKGLVGRIENRPRRRRLIFCLQQWVGRREAESRVVVARVAGVRIVGVKYVPGKVTFI